MHFVKILLYVNVEPESGLPKNNLKRVTYRTCAIGLPYML